MVAWQRPSQFGSLGTPSSLSSEKSRKTLKPHIFISNLLLGVRIHKHRLRRETLCCRNTIRNFKATFSCGGRRPLRRGRDGDPWYLGQLCNSTKGHLVRENRHISGENVGRWLSLLPVRMMPVKSGSILVLLAQKAPGPQGRADTL